MKLLDLTLDTPAANLALDDALLEQAEHGVVEQGVIKHGVIKHDEAGEVLRLWESADDFVVLGRSSELREVNQQACQQEDIDIYRRSSGGGVVVVGPGCLMVSIVLSLDRFPTASEGGLLDIDRAHQFVLDRTAVAVRQALAASLLQDSATIQQSGTSDLVICCDGREPLKFSGNSMRVKRRHLLYHGTILYDYDLTKIARWLATPKRMPEYREERTHERFVTNLTTQRESLVAALTQQWEAEEPLAQELVEWPRVRTGQLADSFEPL